MKLEPHILWRRVDSFHHAASWCDQAVAPKQVRQSSLRCWETEIENSKSKKKVKILFRLSFNNSFRCKTQMGGCFEENVALCPSRETFCQQPFLAKFCGYYKLIHFRESTYVGLKSKRKQKDCVCVCVWVLVGFTCQLFSVCSPLGEHAAL